MRRQQDNGFWQDFAAKTYWANLPSNWRTFTDPALIIWYKVANYGRYVPGMHGGNRYVKNEHLLEDLADIADWLQEQQQ